MIIHRHHQQSYKISLWELIKIMINHLKWYIKHYEDGDVYVVLIHNQYTRKDAIKILKTLEV